MPVDERTKPSYWRSLKPGDMITLSDAATLEERMKKGLGLAAPAYAVDRTIKCVHSGRLVEYVVLRLKEVTDTAIVVKIVDQNLDIRVYLEVSDFTKGNRKDMIAAENFWLYEEPKNPENFTYNELRYSAEITRKVGDKAVVYTRKDPGEIDAECTENPALSGVGDLLATICEYLAEGVDNPELLILEVGSADCEEGGLITMFSGRNVGIGDVDVLKQ